MTSTPEIQTWSTAPRLYVVDDFVSASEIAHVLQLAEQPERLAPGLKTDRSEAGLSFEMPVGQDAVLHAIRDRMTSLIGFENDLDATFRFRRYAPGEYHPRHLDAFTGRGNELILTALLDLVAPDEGGDTFFPDALDGPLSVPHRVGRLVVWYNHTADGQVDPHSTHEGLRVLRGEKTTLTAFVYKPAYYAATPFPAPAPVERACRAAVVHAGADMDAMRAWRSAADWSGFETVVHDARTSDAAPVADVLIPVDLSIPVRRVLSEQYRDDAVGMFEGHPRVCLDPLLWLERLGFAVDDDAAAGERTRQWIAVVGDECIGPDVSPAIADVAVRAVRALQARTGIIEYVFKSNGDTAIVSASAPALLAQLPPEWWSAFCLTATRTWHDALMTEPAMA